MRRKRARERDVNEASVDMSSMVDLSFLLLVFFLVTTTILASEQDLPMKLPTGVSAPVNLRPVSIRIEPDNRVVLHPGQTFEEEVASAEEGHEMAALRERLRMLKSARHGVLVEIQDGADYQRFVDVLNCLRGEGWDEVGITDL